MAGAKKSRAAELLMRGALRAALSVGDPQAFLGGKHVLIVEDQQREMRRIMAALRSTGGEDLEISTARTVSAAIDICLSHEGRFDVVLINQALGPVDKGLDMLPLFERACLADTAIKVLYSGKMDRKLRQAALAAGFDDTFHADDFDVFGLRELIARLAARVRPSATRKR